MADVRTFRQRRDPFEVPSTFTSDERAMWEDSLRLLRMAGTLNRVTRRVLMRHVRRRVQERAVGIDMARLTPLARRLRRRAKQLSGREGRMVLAAAQAVDELWCLKADSQRRLAELLMRDWNRWRMTPRSRMEEDEA